MWLPCFIDHNIDVTRTEWSADPVMYIGSVGCQSTLVIDELCGSVLNPFSWPCTWRDADECIGTHFCKINLSGQSDNGGNLINWGSNQTRGNQQPFAIWIQCYFMHSFVKVLWIAKSGNRSTRKNEQVNCHNNSQMVTKCRVFSPAAISWPKNLTLIVQAPFQYL